MFVNVRRLVRAALISLFSAVFFAVSAHTLYAAEGTFYLYPESGVYNIGDVFEVEVRVDTGGETINAAEGTIEFNNEEIGIVSITTNDSIFTSWLPAPSFSNEDGTILFGGSNANGYEGTDGNILTIEFEALVNTESQVRFQSGAAILAANGLGTNILTTMASGVYTMTSKEVVPVIEYVVADGTPRITELDSTSHQNSEGWYATSTAQMQWSLPEGVTAVRILADEFEDSVPTLVQPTPITQREIFDLDDGTWFFHVQAQNDAGWGPVMHRQFNVDTTKPAQLTIKELPRDDATDPGVSFFITATDTVSAISHYEIEVDNGEARVWSDDGSNTYVLSGVAPGDHTLLVKAVDEAGNYLIESLDFTVQSLLPPKLTDVPSMLTSGTTLVLRGFSQPDVVVSIWVQENDASPVVAKVSTDSDGNFSFVYEDVVVDGVYTVWAQMTDERGATSAMSEKISIAVESPGIIILGQKAVDVMAIIVPLVGLTVLLLLILGYAISKTRRYRRGVTKETKEAEDILHKTFDALRDQVRDELKVLDQARAGRELTKEEVRLQMRFKDMFDLAEETVGKEIRDIREVPPPTRIKVNVQSVD